MSEHSAEKDAPALRAALAEAWDEGWRAGADYVHGANVNPYRACDDFELIGAAEWHCILPAGHNSDHDRRKRARVLPPGR